MCLTANALAMFLNLLAPETVSTAPGRITVHAERRDAHWIARDDRWCTRRPALDGTDEAEAE